MPRFRPRCEEEIWRIVQTTWGKEMKAYSIFLIALMGVNFALMAYGRAAKVIFVGFGVMAYSICVFWSPVNLDWYPLLERSLFFFLVLLGFVFALYRQHNSRYFTPSFFVFSWVTSVRMLGFPENPNFGEKGGALLLIGGFNAVLLFWIILLVFHRKTYQKILFGLLSACLLVFFCSLSRAELSEGVVFLFLLHSMCSICCSLSSHYP